MELSPYVTAKLRHLFALYDQDHNGVLERDDYELLAHAVATGRGHAPGSDAHEAITRRYLTQFERYKAVADFSRDGRIAIDEWIDFFEIVIADGDAFTHVVSSTVDLMFEMFDVDESTTLEPSEVLALRRAFGVREDEGFSATFAALDTNGDGALSGAEVRAAIEVFFRSDEPSEPGNHFFGPLAPR